ncbi:MAG: hypothetical protein EZS28_012065 [Streblomastix strix]|uniref:Uncharacterized protein n=1 Tax=Streblomastix strix TaxID=222440 RepID=A0A5J4WBT9_9EUKA|nr:MAG: hypothetical protein EZS28_012065 [Streblomastix strix]
MRTSKSEHNPSIASINPINETTIEPEQFVTEDLRHDYEDLFRKNIELIKSGNFTPENTETYCVSILAVLGMLHTVVDRARQAKRDKREYGGSFMIFGEADIEQEDNEVALRRKVELMSKYKQSFEKVEKDDIQRIEIENYKHKEAKEKWRNSHCEGKRRDSIIDQFQLDDQSQRSSFYSARTEERIAKFFIGKDMSEFAGIGIKELPQDIKVVAMSQGSFKTYKVDKQERKGQEITQLIPWSV